MFKCVNLKNSNMVNLRELNKNRREFNFLNGDFFLVYDNSNFAQKIFLKRNVKLLYKNNKCVGYIWTNVHKNVCHINALNIEKIDSLQEGYSYLINSIKKNPIINYDCENNGYNYNILEGIGFIKTEGTVELSLNLDKWINFIDIPPNINFENPVFHKHEKIRCYIQNEIFKSNSRIPLTVEDIYFDESQKYYMADCSFFIKKETEYIGYGQVIIEKEQPFIVNFGILQNFRGKGYAKILLTHILNTLQSKGFKKVMIRANSLNKVALDLYKNIGFSLYKEIYTFQLKK